LKDPVETGMSRKTVLNPKELSERWGGGIGVRTLANWRSVGKGPRYLKLGGRIVYELTAIEEWEKAKSVRSTSEYDGERFQGA
jgi:hypothetical protein